MIIASLLLLRYKNLNFISEADQLATKKFVKDVVGDLTGAMKCAMAQFDESNVSGENSR
jgi:hypothetical protein